MIRIIKADSVDVAKLTRDRGREANVDSAVAQIIADVRQRGDAALIDYTLRFDGVRLASLKVSREELDSALNRVDSNLLRVLRLAAENIRRFHQVQLRQGFCLQKEGVKLGQLVLPLNRAGIYVPGGTASYPSTVLMNIIPAKIAGVEEIIMCTPPLPDGSINPAILAAAKIAGADRVFKIGGAQAVAAMTYGTQSVPSVDKITGPGNIYVATAKRMVFGRVGIDMIAGPSEVLIVADSTAKAGWIAMDMLAQTEHDTRAAAFLVTDSAELARAVAIKLDEACISLPRSEIIRHAIAQNSAILLVDSMARALEISNIMAPEHLEICTADPMQQLRLVRNAGSVFLGQYSPEALGDYLAGPNHTLPTGGSARFSSPLSVDDFVKKTSYICYDRAALRAAAPDIAAFARSEGLEAHARSAEIRFSGEEVGI